MGRGRRALLGFALAAASLALLAPAASAAKSLGSFKVLDGRISQRVEVSSTQYWVDECWEERLYLTGTSDYALQAVRGVKVKAVPYYFDSITLKGLKFTGAGEESLSQGTDTIGPSGPDCPGPDGGNTPYDTETCVEERVDPPTKLELTEATKAPTTESFFSPGGGLALFGPLTDPDGYSSLCTMGSDWGGVTFPAPSKTKRGKLLRAEKPLKINGFASYSGMEGLTDCLCDRTEGYNDVEIDWSLKLKPLGKG
jgi:hypothetical protein